MGVYTSRASHVVLSTTMSLTSSPGYFNALSNPGSISPRINVTRITWTLKLFILRILDSQNRFDNVTLYKLYEEKNMFQYFNYKFDSHMHCNMQNNGGCIKQNNKLFQVWLNWVLEKSEWWLILQFFKWS